MEREDYKSLEDFCSLVRQQKLRTPTGVDELTLLGWGFYTLGKWPGCLWMLFFDGRGLAAGAGKRPFFC